jgi:hypothetical protein
VSDAPPLVGIRDEDGGISYVRPGDLAAAKGEGATVATQGEIDRDNYTRGLAGAAATADAAARGATFGASDWLQVEGARLVGGEDAADQMRQKTSLLREGFADTNAAAEFAGGFLLPVPGSGAAKGLAGAVGKGLAGAAERAGMRGLAGIAEHVVPGALGAAFEGGAMGVGQAMSEAALGNHDLTAERLFAHASKGALLGGAIGTGLHVGGAAVGRGLARAGEGAVALAERGSALAERAGAGLESATARAGEGLVAGVEHLGTGAAGLVRREGERGAVLLERGGAELARGVEAGGERLAEVASHARVTEAAEAAARKLEGLSSEGVLSRAKGLADEEAFRALGGSGGGANAREVGALLREEGIVTATSSRTSQAAKVEAKLANVGEELEGLQRQAAKGGDVGEQIAATQAKQALLRDALAASEAGAAKVAPRSVGEIAGMGALAVAHPGAALAVGAGKLAREYQANVASAALGHVAKIENITAITSAIDAKIASAAEGMRSVVDPAKRGAAIRGAAGELAGGIRTGSVDAARAVREGSQATGSAIDALTVGARARVTEPVARTSSALAARIADGMVQSADATAERVRGFVGGALRQVAPRVADATTAVATRAVMHLQAIAPRAPSPVNALQPEKRSITPQQAASFAKSIDAVKDPTILVRQVVSGQVSRETVEAVRAVYPALFAVMQGRLLDEVAKLPRELPYPTRVSLSVLFDVALDASMKPAVIAGLQSQYSAPSTGGTPPPRPLNPNAFRTAAPASARQEAPPGRK